MNRLTYVTGGVAISPILPGMVRALNDGVAGMAPR